MATQISALKIINGSALPLREKKQLTALFQSLAGDVEQLRTALYTLAQRVDAGGGGNAAALASLVGPGQLSTVK